MNVLWVQDFQAECKAVVKVDLSASQLLCEMDDDGDTESESESE